MKNPLSKLFFISLIAIPILLLAVSNADQDIKETEIKATQQFEIPEYAKVYSTETIFDDAKADLLEAIESNGLVISYTSHAKRMLENTAEVSGFPKSIYNDAEILLFCKADLSHALVAGNPHNIVLCPYSIAIYVLVGEPERVYLSYRNIESSDEKVKALTKPIEDLLIEIIEEII